MKRICLIIAALVVILASPAARAAESQSDTYTIDPVLVTARGYAVSQSNTPGSTGVVESREIVLAPKASLADSLGRIPGLKRTGDSPWGQDISIRGLAGPSVIILINGKRINTATDMNARLGFINPADVERIEVLKGPVSALYGSGSTGGVVNIITRKGAFTGDMEVHGRIHANVSSNPGGGGLYGNLSLSGPRAWGFASGAYREYGDTFGGRNTHLANSDFMDTQGRAMLGLKPWDPLTLTFEYMQSHGNDIGIPGGVSSMPAWARVRYPKTLFTYFGADAALDINGRYLKSLEASFYYTENQRRVQVDKNPFAGTYPHPVQINPAADHETYGGRLQATFEAGEHTIVTGADFWTWDISSRRVRQLMRPAPNPDLYLVDSPTPDARQVSIGLFAEDDWKLNRDVTLNIGARLDYLRTKNDPMYNVTPAATTLLYGTGKESDLGWHVHAGLTWKLNEAWSQSFLLASSYRAGDVMERFKFISLGGGVNLYGNPEIEPEQSLYAEYGLHYDVKPFKADMRLFANIITNYIAEKRVNATRIELSNVDDARIYGAELEMRWDFAENWGAYGSVAVLYGRDEEKSQALPGIAPVNGRIGVDYKHSGFWARFESDMIAAQRSTPENVGDTKGVILLNAAVGYTFKTRDFKHDISLTLDNLCNTRYYNYLAHQRGNMVWEPGFAAMVNYSVEF